MKLLADIVLNPQRDYYTFKTGSRWLMYYLETRTFLNGDPINLPGKYLKDALKKLKEREFKFAQEDILFNVPTVASSARKPTHVRAACKH